MQEYDKRTKELLIKSAAIGEILKDSDHALKNIDGRISSEQLLDRELTESLLSGNQPPKFLEGLNESINLIDHGDLLLGLGDQEKNSLNRSSAAYQFLIQRGIDPESLLLLPNIHALDLKDVGAAVAFGIVGAVAPSISPTGERKDSLANILHREQDDSIKKCVEEFLGSSESKQIDTNGGIYHRYMDHSHDPFRLLAEWFGSNSIDRISVLRLFSHLIIDACGATGIPLPGSTYVREWLGLLDSSNPRLSTLHSRYASFRASDAFSTGITSLGLWIYEQLQNIPKSSLRRQKMGIIAHGVNSLTMATLASVNPRWAVRRSLYNWMSVSLLLKNSISLAYGARKLRAQSTAIGLETTAILDAMLSEAKV